MVICTVIGLNLTRGTESRDALQVTDNASRIVYIFAAAMWAVVKGRFADISAVVADGVHDVICEVVAAFFNGNVHEQTILLL